MPARQGRIFPDGVWSRVRRVFSEDGDLQMSKQFELLAEDRSDNGKGASRRLRRAGQVPAILYGGGRDTRALSLHHETLLHQMSSEAFYSSILTVTVGDKSQPCVLKDVQRHPAKPQVMHVDLQRVLEDVEIRVRVPMHFINEDVAHGVKQEGGVVSHLMNEVEVSCLPKHLPEYIELDIAELELDESIMMSQLSLPEGVSIPELAQGEERDQPVVAIHRIKAVVIEPEEGEEAEEAEAEADEVPTVKDEEQTEDQT
jgi:large subunit ribosomal protein L25